MKTFRYALLVLLICGALLLAGMPWQAAAQDNDPDDAREMSHETFMFNEEPRTYSIFVPSGYDGSEALPLLMAFHPAGGDGASMARYVRFNRLAEEDNVIVVYPDGLYGYWDYGAGLPEWQIVRNVQDDPAFVEELLAFLLEEYAIDESQIYAAGYSNGSRMVYRMACDMGDRLAGVVTVAATISTEVINDCPESSQLPVMFVHGTDDTVTPWEGKPLYEGAQIISYAVSAPDTVNFWAVQNGCALEPEIEDMPDANPDDRISVRQAAFTDCASEDLEVIFYAVLAGGHGWPGGIPVRVPESFNPSGSATEYAWDFFGFHDAETEE